MCENTKIISIFQDLQNASFTVGKINGFRVFN